MRDFVAFVTWQSNHITRLVKDALRDISGPQNLSSTEPDENSDPGYLLQWAAYDSLVHALTLQYPAKVLSSSYTIRKALIRKHFLHGTVVNYLAKSPDSVLKRAIPPTWPIEISFADELDELWSDELYELSAELEKGDRWYILKPGMADRGQGIRIFNSRESLYAIFESFEDDSEDEDDVGSDAQTERNDKTAVVTSQLRHFVIQEYLDSPLLVDPSEASTVIHTTELQGRKFHLRVYCVASGALRLYMCPNILALFAGTAYTPPHSSGDDDPDEIDLSPHLTNTSLQDNVDESSVRLLRELAGCTILSGPLAGGITLSLEDISEIEDQAAEVLGETFKAALASSVHFQVLPNAFELFGADLLVTHAPESGPSKFQVSLLELNAEPAIELTGARLNWILVDLFKGIAHTCIKPFFEDGAESLGRQDSKQWLRKCLDVEVRGYK
ncbi:hypothetical protein FRC09_005843 [Ceratobasidium sp. 395]|nr:hypothetical protein FRC09_005843 [Ceratobasidium sp. 395]